MVAPPFNISELTPGDSDIVSQFPANERTNRATTESWLLVNHDTNGDHFRVDIPRAAGVDPVGGLPAAGVDVIYTSSTGRLLIKHADGSIEYVGTPPGVIAYWPSLVFANPTGWLVADGSAVSRTTYADLFLTIGTTFGIGDGVTTFNLPDIKGRMIVGTDSGAGRITTNTMTSVGIGGVGGNELTTLLAGNIPGGVPVSVSSLAVFVTGVSLNVSGTISGTSTGSTAAGTVSGTASGGAVTGTATGNVTGTASVTSTTANTATGIIQSANVTGGADRAFTSSGVNQAIASSGNISATFSSGSISGTISTPATVSGSFSGAAVSAGTVSGTFTGSGSGGTASGTGTGVGATTGTAAAFSNMPQSIVLTAIIRT